MSFTSSFAHLDGVEFRLNDTLQMSPIEGLPTDFRIKDPTRLLLASEYDFSKEREAIATIDAKRRSEQKMAEEEAERKRMSMKRRDDRNKMLMDQQKEILQRQRELFLEQKRRQQQEKTENENKTSDRISPELPSSSRLSPSSDESSEEKPPPLPPKTYFSQLKSNGILTPLPAAQKAQAATDVIATTSGSQPEPSHAEPVSASSSQIWVDFEDKEQDPFTNMELKTIDDMKELQSVLQNAAIDPKSNENLAIPSYGEATSAPQLYENVQPTAPGVAPREVSSAPEIAAADTSESVPSFKPQYPFYADVAEISTKLKTIVMAAESSSMPTSGHASSSTSSTDVNQNYENVTLKLQDGDRDQPEPPNDEGTKSPTFDIPAQSDKQTTLYENVTVIENTESHFKFKTAEKPEEPGPLKTSPAEESVYDFAKDPINPAPALLPKSPMDPVTQKRLSPVSVMYGNLGREEVKGDLYSKVVRPRRRAPKAPYQETPPDAVSSQGAQVPSPTNRARPSQGQTELAVSSSNWPYSGSGQSSPSASSSNQYKPDVTARALPVSFGLASNTISTSILPPITSSSSLVENNFMNRPSVSDSGLIQGPAIPPRRPAVPPRAAMERGQVVTSPVSSHMPTYPVTSRGPAPGTFLTQNGTVPPTGAFSTAGAHHYPPYALPPAQSAANGPTVAIKSNSAVSFSNPNSGGARPTVPPRKNSPSPGAGNPPESDTFIKKSQQDRARFEETINKALSSLPKNPAIKPVIAHKPTSPPPHRVAANLDQPFSAYTPLPSTPRSPSPKTLLLQSLSTQERDFVNSMTSMGFDVEATVRATKSFGCEVKEVVDHLCTVQRISEQGYSTKAVQDALEIYKEDKEITKYLHHASQLIDMGFSEGDVKNALVSNDNDQTKALDQLMAQT